ncbi:MAG: hypothetical protein AABX72_04260, partial [Nanoarchaeota archaeon]
QSNLHIKKPPELATTIVIDPELHYHGPADNPEGHTVTEYLPPVPVHNAKGESTHKSYGPDHSTYVWHPPTSYHYTKSGLPGTPTASTWINAQSGVSRSPNTVSTSSQ